MEFFKIEFKGLVPMVKDDPRINSTYKELLIQKAESGYYDHGFFDNLPTFSQVLND